MLGWGTFRPPARLLRGPPQAALDRGSRPFRVWAPGRSQAPRVRTWRGLGISPSRLRPGNPSSLLVATAITHLGRPGQLHHHLGMVIVIAVGRLRHLEFILAQQNREDRFYLHLRESGPDATVPPCSERNPGPPVGGVRLLGLVVAV